jgi:hypothetical protein
MVKKNDDPLDKIPGHLRDQIPVEIIQKIAENQALQEAVYDLSELFDLLKQDVAELHKFGSHNETGQPWRRSSYRAVFSWIEGVVYQMKQIAMCTQGGFYQAKLSRAEIAFLQEESYFLDEKGKVVTKSNNFAEINKNLRFAYAKLAEGFNISTELEIDRQGWQQFKRAIEIRNRLTHPKNITDLFVTDEHMGFLLDTMSWFDTQISKLIADVNATVEPTLKRIREEGQADIKRVSDNAMAIFTRAGKAEDAITILDELIKEGLVSEDGTEKIEIAKSRLNELKKDIVSDLISARKPTK